MDYTVGAVSFGGNDHIMPDKVTDTPAPVTPQASTAQPSLPNWVVPGMGYLMLTLFGVATVIVLVRGDPQYVAMMLTAIITMAGMPLGFYFGSSASSAKKDDTVASLLSLPPAAAPPVHASSPVSPAPSAPAQSAPAPFVPVAQPKG